MYKEKLQDLLDEMSVKTEGFSIAKYVQLSEKIHNMTEDKAKTILEKARKKGERKNEK